MLIFMWLNWGMDHGLYANERYLAKHKKESKLTFIWVRKM